MTAERRASLLASLRRLHGWLGLWGGLVGLLFGLTGIIQNHRAILHIPAKKFEQRSFQLALAETPADPRALAARLALELDFERGAARQKIDPAATVVWDGREVRQPERWQFWFEAPQRFARAEYYVGNRFISVEKADANVVAALVRLHQAIGVNALWVLVADTIAGSLVLLAATGLVLWSRLQWRRLAGLAVSLLPLALAGIAAWSTAS